MTDKFLREVRFTNVSEVMTRPVVFVDGDDTVANAIGLMREKWVSSLIINKRTPEDAWGIITRKDVVNKVVDPGKNPHEIKISEIMTKPVITVIPELALKYCARLMNSVGIRRAPVCDGKEIIGLVSNTDIFNAIEI